MNFRLGIIVIIVIAGLIAVNFLNTRLHPEPLLQARPVPAWTQDLLKPDFQAREKARRVLTESPEVALPHLITLLRSPEIPFRHQLNRYLERVPFLTYQFVDPRQAKQRAASVLSDIGPAAAKAAPDLIELLHDSGSEAALEAERALRRIGPAAIPPLTNALHHRDWQLRAGAAKALRGFKPPVEACVPHLCERVQHDRRREVRVECAKSLGEIQKQPWISFAALVQAMKDSHPDVRAAAAEAAGQFGSAANALTEVLIQRLSDEAPTVRLQASKALWHIEQNTTQTIPVLTQCLEEKEVAWQAAYVLGEIGAAAAPAVPALVRLMQEEKVPRPLRSAPSSVFALGRIGAASVPALIQSLSNSQPRVRTAAAIALGIIGKDASAAAPELKKLLTDKNSEVRSAAALTLAAISIENREAIPVLIDMLSTEDIFVRMDAAALLRQMAPEKQWEISPE